VHSHSLLALSEGVVVAVRAFAGLLRPAKASRWVEDVARKREQLAAAAEARLKALQQKQQLWSVAVSSAAYT
jgi:hypothetical protein